MSRASKISLVLTAALTVTTVGLVHLQQQLERTAMHEGVVRDMEQQRVKAERQLDFDLQKALETEYLKEQKVNPSRPESSTAKTTESLPIDNK